MTSPFDIAKKEGYSDKQIIEYLSKNEQFSPKISQAKADGYSDEEIANFLSAKPTEKQRSLFESAVSRPADIVSTGAAAGIRSAPRTVFDLIMNTAELVGFDPKKIEQRKQDLPDIVKKSAPKIFPTYEESRDKLIEGGAAQAETPIEKGLEKAGRFAGESVLTGGLGGARGIAGIAGAATGAQIGEELEVNPWAQAALTLGGGLGAAKVSGAVKGNSLQKITPEVESYMQASKDLGIDPMLTGMNPSQVQKVAQKWATHGIGGPEILKNAYESRSGQVAKAFEKAMDEAGAQLFTEPLQAAEGLQTGIQEAGRQIERNKSALYRAVDKALPEGATIKVSNPQKMQADLQEAIVDISESMSLSPSESPVKGRLQVLHKKLEELLDYTDGNIPVSKLEATNRSLNDVIKYDKAGGADKLLIPFSRDIRKELDRYGQTNKPYATARKAANDYFADSVVHIRQNLLDSIARSQKPESTLAIMNSVSGIKNVEKALNSLPNGKRMTDSLKRYKLESMLKDKLIDPSTGMMKVDGLKNFLDKKSSQYPVIRELAGPEGTRTLKLLQEAGKGLEKGFNNLVNPSRTADTLIAINSVLSPGKKILSGANKIITGKEVIKGAGETLTGITQTIAPKIVARKLLDPNFAEEVFKLSKAGQKGDWRAFNRILDGIDEEIKKDKSKYDEYLR